MIIFALSPLVNCIGSLAAGFLVYTSCKVKGLRGTFVCFCASVFLWSLCYFLWQISSSESDALFFCRILMTAASFIPTFYLHHLTYLFKVTEEHKTFLRLCYGINVFSGFVCFHPLYILSVRPIAGFSFWPVAGPLYTPFLLFFLAVVVYGVYLIYKNLSVATGVLRNQLRYVLIGTLVGWCGGATNFPLWYGIEILPFGNVLVSGYIACVSYAILRHRLLDITVIIRKTLIYSMVMGALTIIYLGVAAILAGVFQGFTKYQTGFVSAIASGVIVVLFQPIRKRVQDFVDRKFFRQYVDREEKLYELSREVATHVRADALSDALMRVLGETFHPKAMALYLASADGDWFTLSAQERAGALPKQMSVDNALATYLANHPQPFVHDRPADVGEPKNTRRPGRKEEAA